MVWINQTAARRYPPDRNPIDMRLRIGGFEERRAIAGVVGDVRQSACAWPWEPCPPMSCAMVLGSGMKLVAIGLAEGVASAAVATRLLSKPARRATRVDPVEALRRE